jgi:hypothetical protein
VWPVVAAADPNLNAALARLGQASSDQRQALEELLQNLRRQLGGGAVRIGRRGLWGFGRLETVQFVVGDHSYRLVLRAGKLTSEIGDAVGGVGLTHHPVAWSVWTQHLTQEINGTLEQNP